MTAASLLSAPTTVLRVMELRDVPLVAELHREMLPGGFFVALGPRFLRAYHLTFLTSPAGVGLVAEVDGRTVGFVVGTIDETTHLRHVLRRDRWRLGVRGFLPLAGRPRLAVYFVRTRAFRYGRGMRRLSQPASSRPVTAPLPTAGVLSHVVVEPTAQGRGVGSLLVRAFADTAKAQGAHTVRLLAAQDNHAARSFYEELGWERGPERCDPEGHRWVPYALTLA